MNKKPWLLIHCFAATLGVHSAALLLYLQYPHLFQPQQRERVHSQQLLLSWEAERKNQGIEEAFNQILALTPPERTYEKHQLPVETEQTPLPEKSPSIAVHLLTPAHEEFRSHAEIAIEDNIALSDVQLKTLSPAPLPTLEKSECIPVGQEISSWGLLFDEEDHPLPADLSSPDAEKAALFITEAPPQALPADNTVSISPHSLEEAPLNLFDPLKPYTSSLDTPAAAPSTDKGSYPQASAYALIEDLPKAPWREAFHVDVKLLPQEKNFLFSLSLAPTADLSLSRLKQNFFFLIDRSNSIEKHRYQVFKRAVLKALSFLRVGDTFNIFILDQEIARLSNDNLVFNPATLQRAESFLEKQAHGGLFSATDIYATLEKLTPSSTKDNELYTAIFLTDGDSLISSNKQRKTIQRWMNKNGGKLALFTAAVGKDNNLSLLEMLSACNRGRLLYSETYAAFPRKLAKLVHDLRNPIATDLRISAVSSSKKTLVLYPPASYAPNLYADQPYLLTGSMTEPADFTLLIEGKHNDQWINLEKKISFQGAQKGGAQLKIDWAKSNAYFNYEKFLHSGNVAYLDEAKALLAPQ